MYQAGLRQLEERRNSFTAADADYIKRRTGPPKAWAERENLEFSQRFFGRCDHRAAPVRSGRGCQTLRYQVRDRGRPRKSTSAGKSSLGVDVE